MNGYFYIDNISKQQCGPFSVNELVGKDIRPETMVWCSGMADWAEARTVDELALLFDSRIANTNPDQSLEDSRNTATSQPINQYNANGGYVPVGSNPQQGQYNNNTNTYNNRMGLNDVRPMPKNWLVESILVTVLCCIPFGIAGIVSATKVEGLYYSGDYEAAEQASKDAKKWTLIGFCSTFIIFILGLAASFWSELNI